MSPTAEALLALIGIIIVIFSAFAGIVSGIVGDPDNPDVKKEIERRKKEAKRRQEWKDKLK